LLKKNRFSKNISLSCNFRSGVCQIYLGRAKLKFGFQLESNIYLGRAKLKFGFQLESNIYLGRAKLKFGFQNENCTIIKYLVVKMILNFWHGIRIGMTK